LTPGRLKQLVIETLWLGFLIIERAMELAPQDALPVSMAT
jgi:hypothetical protein